jgi:hypothetical protein
MLVVLERGFAPLPTPPANIEKFPEMPDKPGR